MKRNDISLTSVSNRIWNGLSLNPERELIKYNKKELIKKYTSMKNALLKSKDWIEMLVLENRYLKRKLNMKKGGD